MSRNYLSEQNSHNDKYHQGRVSPKRVTETLDRVEIMSTDSAESTVEDRLRVLEEGPEGWMAGVPRPWSMRSPTYDKPLPMPSRTPSPADVHSKPSPSPVGRRERERTASNGHPVKVLFPQDDWRTDEMELPKEYTHARSSTRSSSNSPEIASPTPKRASSMDPQPGHKDRLQASPSTPQRASPANSATQQRLLDAYKAEKPSQAVTPLGFASRLSPSAFPAYQSVQQRPPAARSPSPSPSPSPQLATPLPMKQVDRSKPLTPFSFAELLDPRQASPTGHSPTAREISPRTHLMDLAERGESGLINKKTKTLPHSQKASTKKTSKKKAPGAPLKAPTSGRWEQRSSKEFFANAPKKGRKDDWKVERGVPSEHFFDPQLFDEKDVLQLRNRDVEKKAPEPEHTSARKHRRPMKQNFKHPPKKFDMKALQQRLQKPKVSAPAPAVPARTGRKDDWKTLREHSVEHFFTPRLFDEAESGHDEKDVLSLRGRDIEKNVPVHKPQKKESIHLEKKASLKKGGETKRKNAKAKVSPRKGRKDDWKAHRKYHPDHFFVPRLFHHSKGAQQTYTPGEWLKRDWKSVRRHFVNHYFNPRLFDSEDETAPISLYDWYRTDWKVNRTYSPEHFFVPSLFDTAGDGAARGRSTLRVPNEMVRAVRSAESQKSAQSSKSTKSSQSHLSSSAELSSASPKSPQAPKSASASSAKSSKQSAESVRKVAGKQESPESDMSYSEAVFGRYKASTSDLRLEEFEELDIGAEDYEDAEDYEEAEYYDDDEYFEEAEDFEDAEYFDDADDHGNDKMFEYEQHRAEDPTHSELSKRHLTPSAELDYKRPRQVSPLIQKTHTSAESHSPQRSQSSVSNSAKSHDSAAKSVSHSSSVSSTLLRQQDTSTPDFSLWETVIAFGPNSVDHAAMVDEAISVTGGGLPADLVPGVWLSLLDIPMVDALCQVYPDLLTAASSSDMIEYDVDRAVDDPEEYAVLSNILHAYTAYDPVCGYAPGMLHIAMLLREELTEEQSFAGLVRIYFAWDHRRLVVPGVDGLRESLFIFDSLLSSTLPKLHQHLGNCGVSPDLYASAWFHALCFAPELDRHLLTWFLMDGRRALVSTAVSLMALNEARLLSTDDPEEINFILLHDLLDSNSPDLVLDFSLQYYPMNEAKLRSLQQQFSEFRTGNIEEWKQEESMVVQRENERVMSQLAKLSMKLNSILSDRYRLVDRGHSGRQEISDLHYLCYEQAYRLHIDDARIISDQFYQAIEPESNEVEEQERIADELVSVKLKYAEAQAELDQLRNELATNVRHKGRTL